jgi:hypothetical protein
MKILNTLRRLISPAPTAKSAGFAAAWMQGDNADAPALATNPYLQSTWVYAAINAKAAKLAQIPFKLVARGRGGSEQEVLRTPANSLFERPHPGLDAFAFWVLNVIAPLCRRLEAGLQPLVAAIAGPTALQGYFDLDELPEMQNARRLRVDAAMKLFNLGVPLNDINRALDLGLPFYAWGGTGWVGSALQPAGQPR